jgi:hypothetical protein
LLFEIHLHQFLSLLTLLHFLLHILFIVIVVLEEIVDL